MDFMCKLIFSVSNEYICQLNKCIKTEKNILYTQNHKKPMQQLPSVRVQLVNINHLNHILILTATKSSLFL